MASLTSEKRSSSKYIPHFIAIRKILCISQPMTL